MPTFELKCPYCESKNVVSKNTKLKYGGVGAATLGVLELVFIAKKWYNRRYEKRISSNKLRK